MGRVVVSGVSGVEVPEVLGERGREVSWFVLRLRVEGTGEGEREGPSVTGECSEGG